MAGLSIGIRYLTGYAVATDATSRERPEWPPHPARVFMALTAAYFEAGGDESEKHALEWLQSQGPPSMWTADGSPRETVTAFVPVNDAAGPAKTVIQAVQGLPRNKQQRTFPRMWLEDEWVYLTWPDAEPEVDRPALERLCSKVTRIGHSSSLVQMWVVGEVPVDGSRHRWEPDNLEADKGMRVPTAGLLDQLEEDFSRAQRPTIGTWQGYRWQEPDAERKLAGTVWESRFVVRRLVPKESSHQRLDLVSSLQVTRRMHEAALAQAREPIPEFISGHQTDGTPTEAPHLAYLPLAFVGSEHATGQLMGLGIAIPSGLDRAERTKALAAVGQVDVLNLGSLGQWHLTSEDLGKANLQPNVWTAGSRGCQQWVTVTPIAFDRHPKARDRAARERELGEMVSRCCSRVGLPRPAQVAITPVSPLTGVPAAHEFPRLRRKDGSERRHAHAIVQFDEPVRGPIALGAGRYRGYGLCRPLRGEGDIR